MNININIVVETVPDRCPACRHKGIKLTVNGHDIWQCDNTECDNWKGDR